MISILIPSYNYSAFPLAESLSRQVQEFHLTCEIIVADDASTDSECRRQNYSIDTLPHCFCLKLTENVGRSRIRNLLASEAKGEWLLFLDCDGMPVDGLFLTRYVQTVADAGMDTHVVCGGIVHPDHLPSPSVSLRYKYEKQAEPHNSAFQRSLRPYASFRTFNFMIRREVFLRIQFDESFHHYGYEDVLFGLHLQQKGLTIRHIDNPLENKDIESNDIFLQKTEEALRTLHEQKEKLGDSVLLHHHYLRLCRLRMIPLVRLLFKWTAPLLEKNLIGHHPNLYFFMFYKMGYYASI